MRPDRHRLAGLRVAGALGRVSSRILSDDYTGSPRYSTIQMVAHWAAAFFCVVEFVTSRGIQRTHLGRPFGIKPPLLDTILGWLHQWVGWTLLMLALALLADRVVRGAPPLPRGMRWWQCLL